jgi:predicted nucleic acid-binding protein
MTGLLFAAPLITRDSTAHSLSPASPCMKIVYGLELKGATAQLQKALLWLNQNEQITPTASDYLQAAIIKADCLIAAVAIRLGLPLVTGNTEDFQAIQKNGVALHIENWRNP